MIKIKDEAYVSRKNVGNGDATSATAVSDEPSDSRDRENGHQDLPNHGGEDDEGRGVEDSVEEDGRGRGGAKQQGDGGKTDDESTDDVCVPQTKPPADDRRHDGPPPQDKKDAKNINGGPIPIGSRIPTSVLQAKKMPQSDDKKDAASSSIGNIKPRRPVSVASSPSSPSPSSSYRADSTTAHRHGGLSELSKQLRVLQAKNLSQSNEIDRLERQLQILADLKGVSVSDLRNALSRACEDEAHADLRSQVAKLRADLDAAALSGRSPAVAGAGSKEGGGSLASFEKESSDRKVADLQLRIGELEEVEENLRKELGDLYDSLRERTSKATELESRLAQKEAQIEELLKSLSVADRERSHADSLKATEQEASRQAEIDALSDKLRAAELEVRIGTDRSKLLQDQIDAREKDAKLRSEQFKTRSRVQDERIYDLEQQLTSLYAAFEMLSQERTAENERRSELQNYLNEADSEVARQLDTAQSGRGRGAGGAAGDSASGGSVPANPPPPPPPPTSPPTSPQHSAIPVAVGTPIPPSAAAAGVAVGTPTASVASTSDHALGGGGGGVPVGTRVVLDRLAGTPEHNGRRGVVVSTPEGEDGRQHVYLEDVDVTLSAAPGNMTPEAASTPEPPSSSASWKAPSPQMMQQVLASGFLLKRENKVLKGWKKRFFVLRGSYGIYQMSYADGPRQRAKGTLGIATGVSSVTRTKQFFPNQRYAFVLHANRSAAKAPILCAAASSEEELQKWLSALLHATRGENAIVQDDEDSSEEAWRQHQDVDDHAIALRMQSLEFS